MNEAQRDIKRKLAVLNHAKESGNISRTCRHFGISRQVYYKWKRRCEKLGEEGLINGKPCPSNPNLRILAEVEEKILYLRRKYHFGQLAISSYMFRYHNIRVSPSRVYYVLKRNGMNRLPKNYLNGYIRYEKRTP